MKARLTLTVLLLVVLPTAVLTLMAGRVLRNWELILSSNMELAASNAIGEAVRSIDAALNRDLQQVRLVMMDCLVRGWEPRRVDVSVRRARGSLDLVEEVYVFMNPWGFLYPRDKPGGITDAAVPDGMDSEATTKWRRTDALVAELRRQVASAMVLSETIAIAMDGNYYLFAAVQDRKSLYVGYAIDLSAFRLLVKETLTDCPGGAFCVFAESPVRLGSSRTRPAPDGELIVSDSLGRTTVVPEDGGRGTGGADRLIDPHGVSRSASADRALAAGRLLAPFDFVALKAAPDDPAEVRRMGRSQSRLYGWGLLLLAGGVVLGAGIVFRQAAVEIQQAHSRSDFVIGVSHDLRTPVASMHMLAESLYLDHVPDAPKRRKFLGTILRESERLSQLIERVLFLVRFGQGALVYRMVPRDPGELASETVRMFQARFTAPGGDEPGGANVSLEVAPDIPMVAADESAVQQVLLNLLDNAVKYANMDHTPRAIREPIEVSVAKVSRPRRFLGRPRDWVCISVRDQGMGIARGELRRVFRRFHRAPAAMKTNVSGVGLGLALCRHVALAHGGWIEADSELGRGSTFSVFLPALREDHSA